MPEFQHVHGPTVAVETFLEDHDLALPSGVHGTFRTLAALASHLALRGSIGREGRQVSLFDAEPELIAMHESQSYGHSHDVITCERSVCV